MIVYLSPHLVIPLGLIERRKVDKFSLILALPRFKKNGKKEKDC
jgi:hypothetical protein